MQRLYQMMRSNRYGDCYTNLKMIDGV